MSEIKFFNRYSKKIEREKVYGDKWLEWIYNTPSGQLVSGLVSGKSTSKLYGKLQDLSLTKKKVAPFIENFQIPMDQYRGGSLSGPKENSYRCFNEFFIREFEEGVRSFPESSDQMGAFAEARYLGWSRIDPDQSFPVKGEDLSASKLINKARWFSEFEGGPLLIARLCPVDYHRYHYPLDGQVLESFRLGGMYYSVNPLALKFKSDIFHKNERMVSILETPDFGKLAYIEVGATMVGKIVQTHDISQSFQKGQEKGYFLFGASTVIVMGQRGRWRPSRDITLNTAQKLETYVHLGDEVARLPKQ